jgi:excisionase family DNA binding protein
MILNEQNIMNTEEIGATGCDGTADLERPPHRVADMRDTASGPRLRLAFSVKEAAQILGVSEKSVRRLVDRRLLRPSRALRHLLIPRKEIERFLDETIVE